MVKSNHATLRCEQDQIAAKAEEASALYKADTPLKDQTVRGHRDAVDDAVTKLKRDLVGKFSKMQAIANPIMGPEFMDEVCIL